MLLRNTITGSQQNTGAEMNTDKSISEVMQESGFTNQTIFNRLFKEIYGMTPRQARNSYAENTYS